MSAFDIGILIILGFGAVKGYLRGFIIEVFSLLAFFIGIIVALELTIPVTHHFFGERSYFEVIAILVFIALFILLSFSIRIAARLIKKMVDVTIFGKLDNFAGSIIGVLKWGFLLSVVFWVFDSIGYSFDQNLARGSVFFPYLVIVAPLVFEWLGNLFPFIQDLIDAITNTAENNMKMTQLKS